MPEVTVLMAVYNGESHLTQAIDSILGQTYEEFEFVIIDDCSTDRSRDIVLSYGDPRIRFLENERNLGLARSLNRGLATARGEFVARLDADDISEPERLERQVAFLAAHSEVALLGTWYTEIDEEGQALGRYALPCDHTAIRWAMLFYCPFVHSAVMWRRALIESQVGGYDESLRHSMDFDLWTRVAHHLPVANLSQYLVRLRLHPGSMTMTYGDHTLEGHRLRIATMARLLRWSELGLSPGEFEERFLALDTLVRSVDNGSMPQRALSALDDVFLLLEAFCDEVGIRASERRDLRIALGRRVARNLARLARKERARPGGLKTSLQFLATASGVWARSVVPTGLKPYVGTFGMVQRTSRPA
jgi:glycosyltransferase involved in cell wall biosynthesis